MVPDRFQTPIRGPDGQQDEDRTGDRGQGALPRALHLLPGVPVLEGDERGDHRAQHQSDLDRSVERVQAEQHQRPGDDHGQRDQRDHGVGERGIADGTRILGHPADL
jgi:hypothetical protein